MTAFLTFIHVASAIFLVVVILMQAGRGGGLTEGFAAAESMFGAKTSEVMVRTTTILASIFLVTSLSLAHFSSKQEESLLKGVVPEQSGQTVPQLPAAENSPSAQPVATPESAAAPEPAAQ